MSEVNESRFLISWNSIVRATDFRSSSSSSYPDFVISKFQHRQVREARKVFNDGDFV